MGEPFIWLTGGALSLCLLMVSGLIGLVAYNGLGFFWPTGLISIHLSDGEVVMGEVWDREEVPHLVSKEPINYRILLKVGNRDIYGADFRWIDEAKIIEKAFPVDAVVFERREWGQMVGFVREVHQGGRVIARGGKEGWRMMTKGLDHTKPLLMRIREKETHEIGGLSRRIEKLRLEKQQMTFERVGETEIRHLDQEIQHCVERIERMSEDLSRLRQESEAYQVEVELSGGERKKMAIADIVRMYRPNILGITGKVEVYLSRVWEFLSKEPRESNTEGGVFPAIFGTVMMVMLMSLAAVPFGVLAALYLREYAGQGSLVRVVRIAVNNLAGVPSIVFGMFGLGFFVYGVGGSIDHIFYPEVLPSPTFGTGGIFWASLTLALLTVPVMIVATEEALSSVPLEVREGSLALGATKFQTIWRVIVPGALPGILTGIILVVARGAGEVAPLMITGVVKLAPSLPIDGNWPFFHLERKFMHLGFHIYDVGFQSPNVEASRPMVYMTTLLLMGIVLSLNLTAIWVRSRLRIRLEGSKF